MFSKIFWLDAIERAIKTLAQAILTLSTVDAVPQIQFNAELANIVIAGLGMAVASILTSIVSAGVRERGTASLVVNPPTPPEDK